VLAVAMQAVSIVLDGIQLFRGQVGISVIAVAIAIGILHSLFAPHVTLASGRT